ncbi:hypothetical protein OHA69_41550 [Streptomyces anulatus]|uniref:hypothetical protein n=1 Tax=Streptomyces anulatus TaxID=1892 RepID=UPI00224DF35C|nr:hypothetical protein [Streptomyces anulatus]MCX4524079.1 hypothetical protein [Streptomyces anulatus]
MFQLFGPDRHRKKQVRDLHFAKQMIFSADAAITKNEPFGEVTTEDVRREALELFSLKVGTQVAYMALVRQLEMRGYTVNETTVEKE